MSIALKQYQTQDRKNMSNTTATLASWYNNKKIMARLREMGATHFSNAYNYGVNKHSPYEQDYSSSISSVYFFSSDKKDANGCYPEIAYFLPDMHCDSLGELSGFNECTRRNGVYANITPIRWGQYIEEHGDPLKVSDEAKS